MVWDVRASNGIWLPQVGWWLDAHSATPQAIVSHAHSDHVARHKELVCSPPTARLLRVRLPGRRIEHVLPFGRTEPLTTDTAVTLHPAGHILGSSLIHLQSPAGSLLYTGDFKLKPGLAAEPCAPPTADVLIMETTFGLPRYVFPPQAQVVADIITFCHTALADGAVPVLYCYSLGKSQEVLRALLPAGLPVMLHPAAMPLTRVYEQFGCIFPAYREFDPREANGHIVICPPPHNGGGLLKHLPARRTAVITGWALDPGATYRNKCDAAFPLSDHADFPDLLRFVELVRPKRVYTVHGFAREFAATLRDRGIEAWALGRANQLELPLAPTKNSLNQHQP
jgi:Cft2 family RNA processing exonuclease